MQKEKWLLRKAPSIGPLEGEENELWGTMDIREAVEKDLDFQNMPSVFFGLYGLPDFYQLWRHRGRKCILWAGTDIIHFKKGYWLDEKGTIKISPKPLATWINKNCESYVENEVERLALLEYGIESKIVPSFIGNVDNFRVSFWLSDKVNLYTSVSGDNFKQYGWDKIPRLAMENPEINFHLFGNTKEFKIPESAKNVFVHGRVSKEEMNEEIKKMTGALRLTEFDGFSEIIAKSLLWGQWPVSIIPYPHVQKFQWDLSFMFNFLQPNLKGREWLLSVVNRYPWNQKICQVCESPDMEDFYHGIPK